MGVGGIGIWQLLIILVIVLLLFGTKKVRNLGSDLGSAIKGFKKAVGDKEGQSAKKSSEEESKPETQQAETAANDTVEAEKKA